VTGLFLQMFHRPTCLLLPAAAVVAVAVAAQVVFDS
jgi:hypothetical protein